MFDRFRWTGRSEKRNELTLSYEPIQVDLLRSLARLCSGAVFLDVGANIGAYAVLISSDPSISEAHAFEPVAALAKELSKNLRLNGLDRKVSVHDVVLSDVSGNVEFLIRSEFAGDSGVLQTHLFSHLPFERIQRMESRTLDSVVDISGREIVMKVDVEGHELNVLRGGAETLKNNRGYLQVEVLSDESAVEVEQFLYTCGWSILFRADRDHYYGKTDSSLDAQKKLELLEVCLAQFISRTRSREDAPYRQRLVRGVTIEVSKLYGKWLRGLSYPAKGS